MPHFCPFCKSDEGICQKCNRVFCSNPKCVNGTVFKWRIDITKNPFAGNVCKECVEEYDNKIKKAVSQ